MVGFVYFIKAGRSGAIKIGHSFDPAKRLRGMQPNCPQRLILIGSFPGSPIDELQLQAELGDHLLRGEWFRNSAAVREAIAPYLFSKKNQRRPLHLRSDRDRRQTRGA